MMAMTGALNADMPLSLSQKKFKTFCTKMLKISDKDSSLFMVHVFSGPKWAADHETAVS